jgi:hypothetical protein
MADLTITAASCLTVDGNYATGVAGAAITAGQALYIDTANSNVLKLADCDASALASTVAGISLHAAASGQPIRYQTSGTITVGGTMTAGKIYVASATAGGIAPSADLTTNWRTSIIGVATSTTVLTLGINNSLTAN